MPQDHHHFKSANTYLVNLAERRRNESGFTEGEAALVVMHSGSHRLDPLQIEAASEREDGSSSFVESSAAVRPSLSVDANLEWARRGAPSPRSYKQDFLSSGNPPILRPGPRTKKGSR